jgi:MoaA/NifB/PqqE/SkfB family radical SAM enzyme
MRIRYDIEADFLLLTTCNFRCHYCYLSADALGAKITTYASNAEWQDAFDATGKTWLLHLTGGEPFVYPDFVDLCGRLSSTHYLSINTNLSHHSVEEFAEKILPERIHFIHAALHLDERERRAKRDVFIRRVQSLQRARFDVLVSLVMTTEMIDRFPDITAELEAHGVAVLPKSLNGFVAGAWYPGAYSREQKDRIRSYIATARTKYEAVRARMEEAPTINLFEEERLLDGGHHYKGTLCGSGSRFVVLKPDGQVVRCWAENLGNLLRRDVRFLTDPKACDTVYCRYFCEKYTHPHDNDNALNRLELGTSTRASSQQARGTTIPLTEHP